MNQPNKPQPPHTKNTGKVPSQSNRQSHQSNSCDHRDNNIVKEIQDEIGKSDYLKDYPIRSLVQQAEALGYHLKQQRLETNQIRKFLDAINQIKYILALDDEIIQNAKTEDQEKLKFSKIETEIVLLKPKLAYAAARQTAVKPLNEVMKFAIDRVKTSEDFYRLVQFIESIIAYHKEADSRR